MLTFTAHNYTVLYILVATIITSLISLVGVFILQKDFHKILHYLISFAAGTFLAVAFFDLLPESLELFEKIGHHEYVFVFTVVGIIGFFLIERFIHWHHCGKQECHRKPAGALSLAGDLIHNFLDGLIIAGAFLVDINTGIFTTIGIILHEIPQEFGDYSVLIHSGYTKVQALKMNFLVGLTAVLGGIIGYVAFSYATGFVPYLLAIAAGGFIYIALSDIVPDLHQHKEQKSIIGLESFIFMVTIIVFFFVLQVLHASH